MRNTATHKQQDTQTSVTPLGLSTGFVPVASPTKGVLSFPWKAVLSFPRELNIPDHEFEVTNDLCTTKVNEMAFKIVNSSTYGAFGRSPFISPGISCVEYDEDVFPPIQQTTTE